MAALGTVTHVLKISVSEMIDEDGLMVAGYMSFAAMLALFPFLLFLAAFVSFLGSEEQVDQVVALMFENLPKQMAESLEPAVFDVLAGRQAGFLTFGIVVTLWASSSGVEALRVALNRAYGVTDERAFWFQRLQSLLFVALAASTALVVSILILAFPLIWRLVDRFVETENGYWLFLSGSRYLLSIALMFFVLMALHLGLPNKRQKPGAVLPGVIATVVLFMLAATAFSFYLDRFAGYSVTYGSMASVVVAMIFFYLVSIIFIFGGYLNRGIGKGKPAITRFRYPPA